MKLRSQLDPDCNLHQGSINQAGATGSQLKLNSDNKVNTNIFAFIFPGKQQGISQLKELMAGCEILSKNGKRSEMTPKF